ncbi:MAG: TadE/TadG family type IV pilus assembly protein, partial [Hyphomicrobiales bacterium]
MKFPKIARLAKKLRSDASGISMVEFALVLPVILTLGLYGAEVARMANTKMKVSQIALSLADNASRLGQTDNSGVTPTITENDVEAILNGALRQGQSIGLEGNAKVILSSLEYEDPEDKQFISWQRCVGDVTWDSRYGND